MRWACWDKSTVMTKVQNLCKNFLKTEEEQNPIDKYIGENHQSIIYVYHHLKSLIFISCYLISLIFYYRDREIQFFELSSFEAYCQISGLETVPLKLDYW